ncbi:methylmalonyl-CoA mutase family protein [Bacteroidota bacterium]
MENHKLFEEFQPVSTKSWENKIKEGFKGDDYSKKLIWDTFEGFSVKPFYRSEDLENINFLNISPGKYPFVRGNKTESNNWLIRQNFRVRNLKKTNSQILHALMNGCDSIGIYCNDSMEFSNDELDELFKDVICDCIEINFISGARSKEILELYINLVNKGDFELAKIRSSVNYDPIGNYILQGSYYQVEFDEALRVSKEMILMVEELPRIRTQYVDASIFHNSGASVVQELTFGLSVANEYLSGLNDLNVTVDEIAQRIGFNFAIGSNFFMEIAKFRAARLLWAQIVSAYNPRDINSLKMHIHAESSNWNKTLYDRYVNIVRTTTETMAGIIGGVDSISVKQFDMQNEFQEEFTSRIARNQQNILREEAYLDKVVDPSAGSYYIENLTHELATKAWNLFLEIEESGGFIKAVEKNIVQDKILEISGKRDMDIALRKKVFIGANQFPDYKEVFSVEIRPEFMYSKKDGIKTLVPYRGSQIIEKLRLRMDEYARKKGKRPAVFILSFGNFDWRKARSAFSSNFFACGGFEVIENNGFHSIEEGVKSAIDKNADIIVLCSSDEEYTDKLERAYELINNRAIMVIAGYPKELVEELEAKGIRNFIHIKSNIQEELKKYQQILGINNS